MVQRLAPLRPLRVLFLNDTARNGGPPRSLYTLLAKIDPREIYRAVALPRPGEASDLLESVCETMCFVPDFVENPIEPITRPMRRADLDAPRALRAVRAAGNVVKATRSVSALARLVKRGEFDLIYCNGTTADFAGATVGALTGVPALWHVRYTHVPDALAGVHERLAKSATVRRIVCVSRAAAKLFPFCEEKIAIVHNAIDTRAFSPDAVARGASRRELGIADDAFIVGAHGRVLPRKGFAEMLRATRLAVDAMNEREKSRAHVVIVGDTPEDIGRDHVAELRALAVELGIVQKVTFVGFRNDVRAYVRDFDVSIVPSVYEDPLPRAVIESMALGVPVIATRVGGIGEMLEDGGGVLVPARDERALADAMLRYMRDDVLRARDGRRGRERACAEFDDVAHAVRIKREIERAVFGEAGKPA